MRIARPIAWLALSCLLLCGCQRTGEVENQAYVLVLGLDRAPDGAVRLTARVPKVGKGSAGEVEEQPGGGKYMTFTATGADWPQACEALERVTPRPLNLSHIEMAVVSRSLASEADFPALFRRVVQTPHLYTTARFVVCEGSAEAFVNAQEAVVGERLSAELKAMLTHYSDAGYIPDSTLAYYDYAVQSIYSDPVAIYAQLDWEASPMRQRYGGAAVFREGVCAGVLNADETRLLRLIRSETRTLTLAVDGETVELTAEGSAKRRVAMNTTAAALMIDIRLSTLDEIDEDERDSITNRLRVFIVNLIVKCQNMGVEPFGFSERAAARFATVPQWLASDWRSLYAAAQASVNVRIDRRVP